MILAHVVGKGIAFEWVALIATPIGPPGSSLHHAGNRKVNHDLMLGSHFISPHQWKEQIYSPIFALFHRWIGGHTCGILHLGGASTTLGFFFPFPFFVKACIELVMGQSPMSDIFHKLPAYWTLLNFKLIWIKLKAGRSVKVPSRLGPCALIQYTEQVGLESSP